MDELLTFMEEDLAYDDDDNPDPQAPDPSCSRISISPLKSRNSLSAQEKKSQDVTFKDIFGSPDKRDIKELGLLSSGQGPAPSQSSSKSSSSRRKLDLGPSPSGSFSRLSSSQLSSSFTQPQSSSGSSQSFDLSKQIRQDKNVPYKPDSSLVVIDAYSRVRLVKSSISIYFDESVTAEAVLKERNIGLEYVSLSTFSTWYRGKGKDTKNFWISGVLTRKTSGVRKSAKGNDYTIWEVNDLKDLEKHYTVFLFGTASSASTLAQIPVGSLVDLVTPSVLQDAASSTIKFSINNATQVRFIATAKDFGICSAIKKDGNKCTAIVNIWECSFCIHHASKELKKLNVGGVSSRKGKGKGVNGNQFPNKSFSGFEGSQSQESLRQQGVFIANFGGPPVQNKAKKATTSKPILSSRMSLQGATNEMKKNPLKWGNPDTVTFVKDGGDHRLLPKEAVPPPVRKPLDLNPMKTRHLTDRDRDLLKMLDSKSQSTNKPNMSDSSQETAKISKQSGSGKGSSEISELITTSIVNNPNAASRNFLQFLTLQHAPKDQVDLESAQKTSKIVPLIMSREKVKSMAKALDFVKNNGPIKKINPNAASGTKRKLQSQSSPPGKKRSNSSKTTTTKIDVEFDFDHESEDFKRILNAKSAHDDELDQIQHEEYFGKLEKKEELENKLLSTFSIETSAVMCRQCKYVALSQSGYCKEQMHQIRMVKGRKRFFKCKDCGNRAMSLDRLPKRPCSICNNSSWLVAPVGRERKGPTLPSEMLAVRGNEEKFVGSAGSKMFLHLEV